MVSCGVSIALALSSAFCSAANLLTQRQSSRAEGGSFWRIAAYLLRSPLWLIGAGAAVAAFAFQAVALHLGRLSVVQPVLVTELVFVLVLRRIWRREQVKTMAWSSAALTTVSLAVFLVAAEPRGGNPSPTAGAWVGVLAAFGGATAVLTTLAARGSPPRRAALYATASAIVGGVEASFIKTAADTFATHGLQVMLEHWPIYALLLSAIVDIVLIQATLHVGPLRISQPLMVVVNPLVSIGLSVWLFEEYFTSDTVAVLVAACSFAAMVIGVVLQALTGPSQQINHAPAAA